MAKLRIFFAWLLLAAVPLQGFASVSMQLCEGNVVHSALESSSTGSLDAGHEMAPGGVTAHDHVDGADVSHGSDEHGELPGSVHKCGVCASCCHGAAITSSTPILALAPIPEAELSGPFVQIHAVSVQGPLKPPRV
jgi:hypothetical protein